MTTYALLGAGGQAREVADFAATRPEFYAVDHQLTTPVLAGKLVGIDSSTPEERDTPVICAIGAPGARRAVLSRWKGNRYAIAVSRHAYVAADVTIEPGCMVAPGSVVMSGAHLGAHTIVNAGATIGHGTVLEEFATIAPGVHIGGDCHIGAGAYLGIGSIVSNKIVIGPGSVIGAGAVVVENLGSQGLYVGVPARRVRTQEGWLNAI